MKKNPLWRFFTVLELSENMRIGQEQSLQHFDCSLLKFGNGDLPIAELPDSAHIPPENLYKIQDDSSIAIRESPMHFEDEIFPNSNANFHAPEQQWIIGSKKGQYKHQRTARLIRLMVPFCNNYCMGSNILSSADCTSDPKDSTRFPVEFLNKFTHAELPTYHLYTKKNIFLRFL